MRLGLARGIGLDGRLVQIFEAALLGADRPCAPRACPQCEGQQKLHCHGCFERYADCAGDTKSVVRRFFCPRCGATVSVIPEGLLPYRCLPVERLEAGLDQACALPPPATGGGARPPPVSEVERGCWERARNSLLLRLPVLRGWLGQRLPVLADDDLRGFWLALRAIGRTTQILRFLAECFKSSLLADYRSLRPPWARDLVPV